MGFLKSQLVYVANFTTPIERSKEILQYSQKEQNMEKIIIEGVKKMRGRKSNKLCLTNWRQYNIKDVKTESS